MSESVLILLLALVALVVLAGVVALVVLVVRRQRAVAPPPAGPPVDPFGSADVDAVRGDPRRLGPGAIVEIRDKSYAVRGSLHMAEGSWTWDEHLLETADGRRVWLSVEEDPELELRLYSDVPGASVQAGDTVELEGRSYRLEESGTASFSGAGTTGLNPAGTVEYRDYQAADGARLSLEDFGTGSWWVSTGEVLQRPEVRVYPAPGATEAG